MATPYVAYADYVIFFQDQAEYEFAVSTASGNRILLDPFHAAQLFNIPWPLPSGNMETIPKGMYGFAPFFIPDAPGPGVEVGHPNPSGIFLQSDLPDVIVPGQAGNPVSSWPPGPDMDLKWAGSIIKSNAGADPGLQQTPIPPRRWIGGNEMIISGEGGASAQPNFLCRDASRTTDGIGLAIRGEYTNARWSRRVDSYRVGLTPHTSWERFYVRFRTAGVTGQTVWQCFGNISPASGFMLAFQTNGTIEGFDINSGGMGTSAGVVFTPVLNTWYLIDITLKFDTGLGTDGRINIFVNHEFVYQHIDSGSIGLNANTAHVSSSIGRNNATIDNQVEYDLDDWICADLPDNFSTVTLALLNPSIPNYSIDWLVGSHVRIQYANSATLGNYTGSKGTLNQGLSPLTTLGPNLVSTTSGDTINALTDIQPIGTQDALAAVIGPVAVIFSEDSSNSGGTDGQIGYAIDANPAVLVTINQTTSLAYYSGAYFPSGMILPQEISPFHIIHKKSADGNTDTVIYFQSVVEYIGIWNNEDDPDMDFEMQKPKFLHNARYANTIWGNYGPVPDAPVYAVGGTYVGNGTYQEILLPAPCHFLWIRPLAGGSAGVRLYGAGLNANFGSTERIVPSIRLWVDNVTFEVKFAVWGTSTESNANTVTYQYIAFCDPGMRFNYCTAFRYANFNQPRINVLLDPQFLPQAAFAQTEISNTPSSTSGLSYKGLGHPNFTGSSLLAGGLTNFGSFAQGLFASGADLAPGNSQTNVSLWRTNEPFCSGVMCQLATYVGNGAASQIITLTPASGRFPLFVLVTPTTGNGQFKDPSHTGNLSSSTSNLAPGTTSITAVGIDNITIGSALNNNGVVYSVFVIPGDSAGFNNGIFYNPNCLPPDGTREDPIPPEGVNVLGDGGLILGGTPINVLLKDISGLYTLIPNKTNDTVIDRQPGQKEINLAIPNPNYKTGYIGG